MTDNGLPNYEYWVPCNEAQVRRVFRINPESRSMVKNARGFGHYERFNDESPPWRSRSTKMFSPEVKKWFERHGLTEYLTDFYVVWEDWTAKIYFKRNDMAVLFKLTWG